MITKRLAWVAASVAAGLGLVMICLDAVSAQVEDAGALPAALAVPATWFVDNSPGEGLVGYWKFDQVAVSRTLNSALLTNQTDLQNGATITESVPPSITVPNFSSLLLAGVNDRVTVSDTAALNVSPTSFSVAAWVRRSISGTADLIYDSGTQANHWYFGFLADNKLTFTTNGAVDYRSTHVVTDSNWHHVAAVVNGTSPGNLAIYLDGVVAPPLGAIINATPSGPKLIGNKNVSLNTPFGGNIDELRLYNRPLTAGEVGRLAAGSGCARKGTSWLAAFEDLQCALDVAQAGDEIWVAGGLYRPGTNRLSGYYLVDGVSLLGGFAGSETSPNQRPAFDPANPLTMLSGDAAGNDQGSNNLDENVCGVVVAGSLVVIDPVSAAVDGLAIRSGRASCGGPLPVTSGGGLMALIGSRLSLSNILFQSNRAADVGAGLLAGGAELSLDHATFMSNTATGGGGGLAVTSGLNVGGLVTITASSFVGNFATHGGAIDVRPAGGVTRLTSVGTQYSRNRSDGAGGAVESRVEDGLVELSFDGDLFVANHALFAGGGALQTTGLGAGLLRVNLNQTTFQSNGAGAGGGALATVGTDLTINTGTFTANSSQQGKGGAVQAHGAVTVTGSTFVSNTASLGGGALAVTGSLSLFDSQVTQNSSIDSSFSGQFGPVGGGVFVSGTAVIHSTWFYTNTALLLGAATDNLAGGGGLAAQGSLTVTASEFRGNIAGHGGGIDAKGSAHIHGSLIQGNYAQTGGGVFADGFLTLLSNHLIDNIAQAFATTFLPSQGGGLLLRLGGSGGQVSNNLFLGNQAVPTLFVAPAGAAMFVDGAATLVSDNTIAGRGVTGTAVSISGTTTLFNNVITSYTVGIEHRAGTTTEDYNLFFGNTADRFGAIPIGSHSQTADPRFVDPAQDDYRLGASSPGLDAGDNSAVPPAITTDLDNGPRYVDSAAPDTGNGPPPIVDIGAYELNNRLLFLPLVMR